MPFASLKIFMLQQLIIQNFALIDSLELEFSSGFNAITGETGAGKSILLDALQLLLGAKWDPSYVRDSAKPCFLQAAFVVPADMQDEFKSSLLNLTDEMIIFRRELTAEGKSKNSLNGRLANLSELRDVGRKLVDIYGQHDHQTLFDPQTHGKMVDRMTQLIFPENFSALLKRYAGFYENYRTFFRQLKELQAQAAQKEQMLDLLDYQIREIEAVGPESGEDTRLLEEKIRLAHAEKLALLTQKILQAYDEEDNSLASFFRQTYRDWIEWEKIDDTIRPLKQDNDKLQADLEEIIRRVRGYRDELSFDSDHLEKIEDRLHQLDKLKRKYGGTLEEVVSFLAQAKEKYTHLTDTEIYGAELTKKIEHERAQMKEIADEIARCRKKTLKTLLARVEKEMRELGIRQGRFSARHETVDFQEDGTDRIEFLIAPNAGEDFQPLAKIASGGEASRMMLALKRAVADADTMPTMIFDEIDANIGGRLGSLVGEKIKEMAQTKQILLITHLPQIASFADHHVKVLKRVERGKTKVDYRILLGEERIRELAQMMSGEKETKISREHAEEMVKIAKTGAAS